jgi:thiaminase
LEDLAMKIEAIEIAIRLIEGETISSDHPYAWLMVFDSEDLNDFVTEVRSTFEQFEDSPKAWEELDALIYEWNESALVIDSGVLDEMFPAKKG